MTCQHVGAGSESMTCNAVDWFGGWNVLEVEVLPSFRSCCSGLPYLVAEEGNMNGLRLTCDVSVDADLIAALRQFGASIGQKEPRAFLLWETCD